MVLLCAAHGRRGLRVARWRRRPRRRVRRVARVGSHHHCRSRPSRRPGPQPHFRATRAHRGGPPSTANIWAGRRRPEARSLPTVHRRRLPAPGERDGAAAARCLGHAVAARLLAAAEVRVVRLLVLRGGLLHVIGPLLCHTRVKVVPARRPRRQAPPRRGTAPRGRSASWRAEAVVHEA